MQQMSSLKQRAVKAAVWTVLNFGSAQILRFGNNLVLTRLIAPEVFGLMTLAYTFMSALHLFSDLGIEQSIIQNKRGDDPRFLNTAWTFQVIRGLGMGVCCALLGWPLTKIYGHSELLWLMPLIGLATVINCFGSTAVETLTRHLQTRENTIFLFGTQVLSIAVTLSVVYFIPTIWGLALSNLIATVITVIWSHYLIPGYSNRPEWDATAFREIVSFGRWIFISTVIAFFALQSDRLLLGKLFDGDEGLRLLGVYGIALTLSELPRQVLQGLSAQVLFPVFSQLADLPRSELREKLLKNRRPLLLMAAVGVTLLSVCGDWLIRVLYDSRYQEATWMLCVLAIGVWFGVIHETLSPALLALGKPQYGTFGSVFKVIFMVGGLLLAIHWWGIHGAIVVIALNDIPVYFPMVYGLARERLSTWKQDMVATGIFLTLLTLAMSARYGLGFGFPLEPLFR